jgi:hypothetical protein
MKENTIMKILKMKVMKTNDININDNDENQTAMKITIITNNKLI